VTVDDGGLRSILVVCSANQCRSPLVAALLREQLTTRGLDIPVVSAGTRAYDGATATDPTRDVARRRGLDLSSHRSAVLEESLARHADLIVALERAHVRDIVALEPRAWPRTFTLKELVRRGTVVGPRSDRETVGEWLGRVNAGRRPGDLLGASPTDDIDDPTTSLATDHPTLADQVDRLTGDLVGLLYDR
jgi:low molecular weight protein-tyrosine phosphatase